MKKYSLMSVSAGISFCLIIALAQCTTPVDEKKQVKTEPTVLVDTISAPSHVDTGAVAMEKQQTKEPEIVTKTETPSTAKPAKKKTPVATKKTTPKPKISTPNPTPAAPAAKPPDVVVPTSTPTPKVEKKEEPTPAPTIQKPSVETADFTLKSSKAVVQGTSTLHDWESKVTKMEGKGSFQTKDGELVAVKDVEIKIEVKGIKSKEGKKMDDKTFETFHSDKNPHILYTFSNAKVNVDASKAVTIEASGKLSMAGVTQPMSLTATGKQLSNGDLQLSVSKKIKMTDYKMEPPVMMLGTLKVGNEVTVKFDFVLEKN